MSADWLIDTNILAYSYDPSEPVKHARAFAAVDRLANSGSAILSTQVLAELYVFLTRRRRPALDPEAGEERLRHLTRTWTVAPVTPMIVLEAARGARQHGLSFWDGMIWAVARLNQVPGILTEDFQDGRSVEGVTFVNPFSPGFDLGRLG